MPGRILVVDDEPLKRITLQIELSEHGYEVHEAEDASAARRLLDSNTYDVVLCDVRMPGMSGLDLLAHIKRVSATTEVVMMTAYADVPSAVTAIKRGAYDYITKPFTTPELLPRIERLLAGRPAQSNGRHIEQFGRLIACSQSMRRLIEQLRGVAPTDRTVLLAGESGVGKELFAEAIHEHSPRLSMPLIRFSCAGLQPAVLESELFGHEKGAFAGAVRQKPGRFELANGGTLLLEDIDDIPVELQIKLLRVVEQRTFERVGGERATETDARLICTTRCDLLKLVKGGRFRDDLYYRLNVISAAIPPLRERPDDIPVLAAHFVRKHAAVAGGREIRLSQAVVDELLRYGWPGNVRELEHAIERGLALCTADELRPEHVLPLGEHAPESTPVELPNESGRNLNDTVADIERRMILLALRQCNQNQARAAIKLGIPRTTLRDKMTRYGILTSEPETSAPTATA